MQKSNKVVYLAGPITGVKKYWEPFEKADDALSSRGLTVLNPARLPQGMTNDKYARICASMLECADVVLFLEGWKGSEGATLEWTYCQYTGKPVAYRLADVEV